MSGRADVWIRRTKQLATVDAIAGGRLRVAIAVGGRADDYEATATSFAERGHTFDAQLANCAPSGRRNPVATLSQ